MADIEMSIKKSDVDKLMRKLDPKRRDVVIKESLFRSAIYLSGWIKDKRLSGPRPQYLGVKTGRLRSSITATSTQKSGDTYFCKIGTNVVYARIHEYGGMTGYKHMANMPARPFMRPATESPDNLRAVLVDLKRSVDKQLSEAA